LKKKDVVELRIYNVYSPTIYKDKKEFWSQ